MKFSENMTKISAALCKFQAIVTNPKKDSNNPYFQTKYAALDEIITTIRPALAEAELTFLQNPVRTENGIGVYTMILHSSGEYVTFDPVIVPVPKRDAQGIGAALTYAKRYSLCAALGIAADEDDDGNSLQQQPQPKQQITQNKQPKQTNKETTQPKDTATDKQRKRFFALAAKRQLSDNAQKAIVYFYTQKTSRSEVTEKEFKDMADFLESATVEEINDVIKTAVQKASQAKGGAA